MYQGELRERIDAVLQGPLPATRDERVLQVRRTVPRAYAPWTLEEEQCVGLLRTQGLSLNAVGLILARQGSAIDARLQRHGQDHGAVERHVSSAERQEAIDWLELLVVCPAPQPSERGALGNWIRQRCRRAGQPWTPAEERLIHLMRDQPSTWPAVARQVQRPLLDVLGHLEHLRGFRLLPDHLGTEA